MNTLKKHKRIIENDLYILIDLLKGGKIDLSALSNKIKNNESTKNLIEKLDKLDDNWFLRPSDFSELFEEIIDNIKIIFVKYYKIQKLETLRQPNEPRNSPFYDLQKKDKYYILFMVYLLLLRSILNTKLGERETEWGKVNPIKKEDEEGNNTDINSLGQQRIEIQKYYKKALKDCYRANHLLSRYIDNVNRDSHIKLEEKELEIIYILKIFLYGNLGNIFYKRYSFQKSYEYYCKAINLTKHISTNPIFTLNKLKSQKSSFKNLFYEKNDDYICHFLRDKILDKSELLNMELCVKKGKTIIELGRFVESIKWFLMAMESFCRKLNGIDLDDKVENEIKSFMNKINEKINYINTIIYNDVVNKVHVFNDVVFLINSFILILKQINVTPSIANNVLYNYLPYKNLALDAVIRLIYLLTMLRKDKKISEDELKIIANIFAQLHCMIKKLDIEITSTDLTNLKYEYQTLLYTSELYLNYLLFLRPSEDTESENKDSEFLLSSLINKKHEMNELLTGSKKLNLSTKTTALINNLEEVYKVIEKFNKPKDFVKSFRRDYDYESFIKELYFIMMLEMDNFAKVKERMKDYLLKESTLSKEEKKKKENILPVITVLKRYNSSNPIIPRPEIEHVRGGGYFIITPTRKKIIIDPGVGFLRNFYNEGFTIQDIDAIMITHAHLDHMADFENIMTLIYEYNENIKNLSKTKKKYIDLFLNPGSACKAMSLISAEKKYINAIYGLTPDKKYQNEMNLNDNQDYVLPLEKKYGFNLTVLPTKHNDILFKEFSVGLKFDFLFSDSPGQKMIIGFTSDTGYFNGLSGKYQECDMIFCHLGDAYYPELYYPTYKNELTGLPSELTTEQKKAILKKIGEANPNLDPLIDNDPESSDQKWDIVKLENEEHALFAGYHLAISGLYTFIDDILQKKKETDSKTIFAISEFPEELESRRVNIGKTIEKKLKLKHSNVSDKFQIINTDIGMRFLYGMPKIDSKQEIKVHCDICALQDIDEEEEYHPASDMRFTCVKAEEERIESRCQKHTIVWVDKWVASTDYINRKLIT